jgi:hypothetical protein
VGVGLRCWLPSAAPVPDFLPRFLAHGNALCCGLLYAQVWGSFNGTRTNASGAYLWVDDGSGNSLLLSGVSGWQVMRQPHA